MATAAAVDSEMLETLSAAKYSKKHWRMFTENQIFSDEPDDMQFSVCIL